MSKYKFNIVYKVINLLNGKYYIGAHSTNHPLDNYLGSGDLILIAIDKHGRENFEKEIMFNFETPEEMFAKEKELMPRELASQRDNYNLVEGGLGGHRSTSGWPHYSGEDHYLFGKHHAIETKNKISITKKNVPASETQRKANDEYWNGKDSVAHRREHGERQCERFNGSNGGENRRRQSETMISYYSTTNGLETRLKISRTLLAFEKVQERLQDIEEEPKTWGWKTRLAKKWDVCSATVTLFLYKYSTSELLTDIS